MYVVWYWLDNVKYAFTCGCAKESAAWAWRIMEAYADYRPWLEWKRPDAR
jgi:hypothetical protein